MKRKFHIFVLLVQIALFVSCVSHPKITPQDESILYPEQTYIPQKFDWQEIAPGIWAFTFHNKAFPVIYHAVKINLNQAELKISCFPDSSTITKKYGTIPQEIPQPFIYKGIKTKNFAQQTKSIVAINASPFGGKNGAWDVIAKLSSTRQIVGVHKADGILISKPLPQYCAICFYRQQNEEGENFWRAKIESSQTEESIKDADYAFGGFFTVLEEGIVQDFPSRIHDSRSGVGISEDGTILYLMVAEGENPSKSEGLSYPQCGQIFKAMGCYDAMELDGGGSTELCLNGKSVLTYKTFRYQGNSFGFTLE